MAVRLDRLHFALDSWLMVQDSKLIIEKKKSNKKGLEDGL
jgi:hypothetical protein